MPYLSSMRTNSEQWSPAFALMVRWSRLWGAALAAARAIVLVKRNDPRRAAREAEQLEIWARLALFNLLGEIAALEAGGSLTKDDRHALSECRAIVGALAGLCLLCANVRRGCARRIRTAGRAPRLRGCLPVFANGPPSNVPRSLCHCTLGLYDSS